MTAAASRQTTYTYDNMDRLATRTDPLTHAGNLTQVTDRKSQVTTFTYDGLDRRTVTTYPGAATVTATYDAGHRVTQLVDTAAGTITRTWDGLDRLTEETTPQGTVSYTYDAASRRATMTVTGQSAVSYTYDIADRLTQVAQDSQTVGLTYDNTNRRAALTLPNGVVLTYAYDPADRLTGLTYGLGATILGTLTYTPDPAGNRTAIGGPWARTNLPAAVASASYNANHQQLTFGAVTMTYDLNGNLATQTEGEATRTYTWNPRNQLTGLSGPGLTATFGYDALGRRWTKTVNAAQTDVLYDGLNPVQEGALPTTPSANLLTGLDLDEFFTRTDAAGLRAFLSDALGSTLALADAAGAVQTAYTYAPFGETTAAGTASTNPYQFTGREHDATGLYSYRARYYHPGLGRFVSEDPIEFAGGEPNLYTYVGNRPTSEGDPLGLVTDLLFDVGFISYDLGRLALGGRKELEENLTALGLDLAGAAIPFVTGLGPIYRAGRVTTGSMWTVTRGRTAVQNAFHHFSSHGAEVGAKNALDYIRKAREFLHNPPPGTLTKFRPSGDVIRYNPRSNTFAVMDAYGTPRTFFKPDPMKHGLSTNLDYFHAQ